MKRIKLFVIICIACVNLHAQGINKFKTLSDSAYTNDKAYVNGNRYQKDAILFVDMLANTHPYYIMKERRDELMDKKATLLKQCRNCTNDSVFTTYLDSVLGKLRDGHTKVIDAERYAKSKSGSKAAKANAVDEVSTTATPCLMEKHNTLFDYTILHDKSICYLQFNQCNDARTLKSSLAKGEGGEKGLPRFDNMLFEMFHEMDSLCIKTLIVDAQYNNGGSSSLCDQLLAFLHPLSETRHFTTYIRFSDLMAMYNPRIAVAKKSWEADGHIDELWKVPESAPSKNFHQPDVFKGNVVFIQGKKTYSSAGILMTMARDNHIGTIVGTTSRFSPSHYGEILPFILPNTGVVGTISSKFFARPDASHINDENLEPDIVLDLDDKATAWKWLLDKYGKEK